MVSPADSFLEGAVGWEEALRERVGPGDEEISSLSHSIIFLYIFALITEEAFLSLLAILWNSAFKWAYLSFSFAFHFPSFHSYL